MSRHSVLLLAAIVGGSLLAIGLGLVRPSAWTGGLPASERPDTDGQGRVAGGAAPAVAALEGSHEEALEAYANLPLTFVENRGQTDTRVRYHAQGSRYAFYLTPEEIVLSFVKGSDAPEPLGRSDASAEARGSTPGTRGFDIPAVATAAATEESASHGVALALQFLEGNPQVMVEGEERAPGEVNYFRGNDPARWRTGLPGYTRVVYRELWPGVDLMLRGRGGKLKYEFRVRPGAELADIRLAYSGASGVALDGTGGLLIETPLGVLRDSPPVAYQEIAGERVPVESRYVLTERGGAQTEYGFAVGPGYDPNSELIIDPGVDYSTFLGGSSHDFGAGIAIDESGNAYVTGQIASRNFPTTPGAFDTSPNGGFDAFATKLNATGSALVYSTYLGGSDNELARRVAIDAGGRAHVMGSSRSGNFPTTSGAFDRSANGGFDAFVTRLNAAGSALAYSTFVGGSDIDLGDGLAIDGAGNAYVSGGTVSPDFPTTAGAFDRTRAGGSDAFVTKLNSTGSALAYSTLLGGGAGEGALAIALDGANRAWVTGSTSSANFPTTPDGFDASLNGSSDVFVTRLNATGSRLVFSTFLGGGRSENGRDVALDAGGNVYVTGETQSAGFPTTPGAFDRIFNGDPAIFWGDGFVTKLG